MSAKIQLLPSGHEFQVERGETVLDAALRAGLSINCRCTNGTCGKCMARIVAGRPSEVLHHDFRIGAADREAGAVLLCRTLATRDLVIEARESNRPEDMPAQCIRTTVAKVERPTGDIIVLNLRTPRSKTLQFLAGQHVRLQVDGVPPRHKSVASCPCNGMLLQFHIRRVDEDPFSSHVFENLKQRQSVTVEGPYGNFLFDEESTRPTLFLAFETGFAPIKSLIEHAIALAVPQPLRLYWVARDAKDHYMDNYCRALQDAMDDFQYVPLSSGDGTGVEGALEAAANRVLEDLGDLAGWDVYFNGPPERMGGLRERLLNGGLPEDRLFVDALARL